VPPLLTILLLPLPLPLLLQPLLLLLLLMTMLPLLLLLPPLPGPADVCDEMSGTSNMMRAGLMACWASAPFHRFSTISPCLNGRSKRVRHCIGSPQLTLDRIAETHHTAAFQL
jgi:hypothetical protein